MNLRKSIIIAFFLVVSMSFGRNVDLSTVPRRDTVQLTIYNSEDLTLVRETRKITFKKGVNPLQFSWANTLIDPTSVELKFIDNADKLEVLDTTFPQDKPQMLYWNVQSDFDGEGAIEITYFTSAISWSADYLCIATADENRVGLEGFVRVTNNSGEDYENAQVRLVVGTINLVEKIAQLAQIPPERVPALARKDQEALRYRALGQMMDQTELAPASVAVAAPKQVIKEGLSEYFIYTIEGTETIPNGWSKRLRSLEAHDVPLKIQYRYRLPEYGDQLVRMYLLANDTDSKLGTTPLPDGMVRIFRDNGRDGLSFLAAQSIKYIPIGDKIELNLGSDPEVIFELVQLRDWRDNIWMRMGNLDVFRRVDDGAANIEINSSVAGWDEHAISAQRIRNYSSKPIDVEIRRTYDGQTIFRSSLQPVLHDYRTVQFQTTVNAGQKAALIYERVMPQGRNVKQNNVTLETTEIKP